MQQAQPVPNTTTEKPPDPISILRDKLVSDYQPKGEREMMLVTQIAQSWVRLQRAHDAENRLFADSDPLTVMRKDTKTFTMISRYVADSERAWRKAMDELRRVQRQRLGPQTIRKQTTNHQPLTTNASESLATAHQPLTTASESLATAHRPLTTASCSASPFPVG